MDYSGTLTLLPIEILLTIVIDNLDRKDVLSMCCLNGYFQRLIKYNRTTIFNGILKRKREGKEGGDYFSSKIWPSINMYCITTAESILKRTEEFPIKLISENGNTRRQIFKCLLNRTDDYLGGYCCCCCCGGDGGYFIVF